MGKGVGNTYFAVMIANYLSNVMAYKVALVQLQGNDDLKGNIDNKSDCVHISGTCIYYEFVCNHFMVYSGITSDKLFKVMDEGYEYIVLDLDWTREGDRTEFIRCDIRFAVGSMVKWKSSAFETMIRIVEKDMKLDNCQFLSLAFDETFQREIKVLYNLEIQLIPYEKDPFRLSGENIAVIFNLFKNCSHLFKIYHD